MPKPRGHSKKSAKKQKTQRSPQNAPVLQNVAGDKVTRKKKYMPSFVSTDEQQLCAAVECGDYIQFLHMIAAGANIHARDKHGMAVSGVINYSASSSAHGSTEYEPKVMVHTYESNYTLLMLAAFGGHEYIVQFLIHCRVDINAVDAAGFTALMLATQQNHIEIVRALILAGADLNKKNDQGDIALKLAVQYQHVEIAALLLQAGAKTDIFKPPASTVLYMAVQLGLNKIISSLLIHRTKINIPGFHDKITPLMLAVRKGELDIAALLVGKGGAGIHLMNVIRQQAVHIVQASQYRELLWWFLSLCDQALINTPTEPGVSLLMLAAHHQDYDLVKRLLDMGADTTLWCGGVGTVMHDAINSEDERLIALFSRYPCNNVASLDNYMPLESAIAKNNVYAVTCLLTAGISPNTPIKQGSSPLMLAAYCGFTDIIEQLLAHGADLNDQSPEYPGARAIDLAAQEGHVAVVERLLRAGAMHHAPGEGETLLHRAVVGRSCTMIRFLLQQGFDINSPNASGATPLHLAVAQGYEDVVQLLFEHDANPLAVDRLGLSVLHYAKEHRESAINALLEQAQTLVDQTQTLVTTQQAGLFTAPKASTSGAPSQKDHASSKVTNISTHETSSGEVSNCFQM